METLQHSFYRFTVHFCERYVRLLIFLLTRVNHNCRYAGTATLI